MKKRLQCKKIYSSKLMRLFGLEIRKAENEPHVFRKNAFYASQGELPETTIDVFFKYFRKNSDVRRCVIELQENVASEGYGFELNDEIIYDLPKIDNKIKNFFDLKRRIIRDISVCGNGYILKLRNATGQIIGYTTIDPRTVKIVADETGEVKQYIQEINGKIANRYLPQDVTHCFDEKDPDNEIFGLSILEGIILDVLSDDEANLSNYHYFKNSTIPSMILKVNDSTSDDEIDNALEMLKANFKGGKNKHKIGILRGVEGIEKLQESMADMQYTALRAFTTERVCAAYGVPKVILNYTEGVNYTNAEMQYKKFSQNTIVPWEKKIENFFNQALGELFIQEKVQYRFVILKSQEGNTLEKIQIYEKMLQCGLTTINEARSELGYEPFEGIEEAEQPLISKNYDLLRDVGLSIVPINTNDS